MKILTAITGASGTPLALCFLKALQEKNIERHLIVSQHATIVSHHEQNLSIDWTKYCEKLYAEDDLSSAVSSGSYPLSGMVVIPCSMNTLAQVAHGLETNLITRSIAVNLKQERPVILVPRESPLSLIHIENMKLAKMAGCSIVPPMLAFYFHPQSIDDLVRHTVGKILELLHIPHQLYSCWCVETDP